MKERLEAQIKELEENPYRKDVSMKVKKFEEFLKFAHDILDRNYKKGKISESLEKVYYESLQPSINRFRRNLEETAFFYLSPYSPKENNKTRKGKEAKLQKIWKFSDGKCYWSGQVEGEDFHWDVSTGKSREWDVNKVREGKKRNHLEMTEDQKEHNKTLEKFRTLFGEDVFQLEFPEQQEILKEPNLLYRGRFMKNGRCAAIIKFYKGEEASLDIRTPFAISDTKIALALAEKGVKGSWREIYVVAATLFDKEQELQKMTTLDWKACLIETFGDKEKYSWEEILSTTEKIFCNNKEMTTLDWETSLRTTFGKNISFVANAEKENDNILKVVDLLNSKHYGPSTIGRLLLRKDGVANVEIYETLKFPNVEHAELLKEKSLVHETVLPELMELYTKKEAIPA